MKRKGKKEKKSIRNEEKKRVLIVVDYVFNGFIPLITINFFHWLSGFGRIKSIAKQSSSSQKKKREIRKVGEQ